ncbi:MAG: hypothetical protein II811_10140, partial [Spirochaetaceae bacterium]|nr:hypothetical protein [Spirochaetaceae bacterium]
MKRYAILCGSAKEDYEQTKISLMHEKLLADGWAENEITIFPNGVNELFLEYALNNCVEQNNAKIFLFFCALSQDCIKDDCITLGNDEIRKSVIAHYAAVVEMVGAEMQVV